jgi:G3E family GTPase
MASGSSRSGSSSLPGMGSGSLRSGSSSLPGMASGSGIALTVIGGFLGAGKTTLLNRVLRDAGGRRLAVLVNDFGAINIDAELVESRDGATMTLTNGCICCGIGGDFIAALATLRDVDDPPEQVVVEASGVADPGQIAVLGDMPGYVRDAVVVVADADSVRSRADDEATGHAVKGQLRAADLLVVSKTDLVDARTLEELHAWLREVVGPSTSIVDGAHGDVPVDVVLGAPAAPRITAAAAHDHDHDHDHPTFATWSFSGDAPLSGTGLVEAIQAFPDGIVRAKGLLHLREDPSSRYLLQLVGRRYSIQPDRPWGDDPRGSRLVVIGLPGAVDADRLAATLAGLSAPPAAPAGG